MTTTRSSEDSLVQGSVIGLANGIEDLLPEKGLVPAHFIIGSSLEDCLQSVYVGCFRDLRRFQF